MCIWVTVVRLSSYVLIELIITEATLERSTEYERVRDTTIKKVEELTTLRSSFEEMTLMQQNASEKLAPASIQVITVCDLLFLEF